MSDVFDSIVGPSGGPPGGGPTLTQLVNVLLQNGRTLSAILVTLNKLTGNLSANYSTLTWAPTLAFGGSSTGIVYATQVGTATMLGRELICRFVLTLSSKGSASGAATLAGLPDTSNSDETNDGSSGLISSYANMASLPGAIFLNVGAAANTVGLFGPGATGPAALTDANFENNTMIAGEFSYFI